MKISNETKDKIWSGVKGALVAATGAALVNVAAYLGTVEIPSQYLPWAQAAAAVLVNIARLLVK